MKRRLFNLAAAVSLVMMLALLALWVHSYFFVDSFSTARCHWISTSGRLLFVRTGSGTPDQRREFYKYSTSTDAGKNLSDTYAKMRGVGNWFNRRGFIFWYLAAFRDRRHVIMLGFPYWAGIIAALVIPFCWAQRAREVRRRLRRGSAGKCSACGYDLRATPDRCPECGMAVAPKPAELLKGASY
jgi:hypothetical protein